jgi:hypothetical protein
MRIICMVNSNSSQNPFFQNDSIWKALAASPEGPDRAKSHTTRNTMELKKMAISKVVGNPTRFLLPLSS